MRPIDSIYKTTAGTTVRVARTNKDSKSTNKQIRFSVLLISKHLDWLRGDINKWSLNVFWYKFYLKKEANHRLDSFVHVFRKFSESNWKFSPVVRFGASFALWCVNATVGHPCYCNLRFFLQKSIYPKFLVFVIFFLLFCMLFGIIKQIWHPCVVYNRNNSPSRGLSPSGYALGRQSSLGGVIAVVHHTGMSYLYINPPCKNGYVARDQLPYVLWWRPGYPRGLESGLSVTSLGDKDQLTYRLHYRKSCAQTCVERNFWAIRRSLVV